MRNELLKLNLEKNLVPEEIEQVIPSLFQGYRDAMLRGATNALLERAEHWNKESPTLVGCSILVAGKDPVDGNLDLSQLASYTGANHKLEDAMLAYPERTCAEMDAFEGILNIKLNRNGEEAKLAEQAEGIEQGDFGLVLAVLTVSKKPNTGEEDTVNHHILESCKQCMTNYDLLMKQGRVSKDTVICNVRLKEGENDVKITKLGQALEQFNQETEKRNQKSIRDLLQVMEEKAVKPYREAVQKINIEMEPYFKRLDGYQIPDGLQDEDLEEWRKKIKVAKDQLQRESRERKYAILPPFVKPVAQAANSAFEEGVGKKLLVKSLGLSEVNLNEATEGFSDEEWKRFEHAIAVRLYELAV